MSQVKTDLSKVNERSIASLIQKNNDAIKKSCESGSVARIYETVSKVFTEAALTTPATERLLNNIKKARTATEATFVVYNSLMAGCGLGLN